MSLLLFSLDNFSDYANVSFRVPIAVQQAMMCRPPISEQPLKRPVDQNPIPPTESVQSAALTAFIPRSIVQARRPLQPPVIKKRRKE